MALMVGLFEAVFFRGFIQVRLQASFGTVVSVAGASALYALYNNLQAETSTFRGGRSPASPTCSR
jgi:membrane protease YdiL (CAAX protease family)